MPETLNSWWEQCITRGKKKNPKGTYVLHTEQVLVLKKRAFKGKDFHSSLEFLQLQLSNRYKEQR